MLTLLVIEIQGSRPQRIELCRFYFFYALSIFFTCFLIRFNFLKGITKLIKIIKKVNPKTIERCVEILIKSIITKNKIFKPTFVKFPLCYFSSHCHQPKQKN